MFHVTQETIEGTAGREVSLAQLIAEVNDEMQIVKRYHPQITQAEVISRAIDGVAEGYELPGMAEDALRDHFHERL